MAAAVHHLVSIDPGLATGALVLTRCADETVLDAVSLKTNADKTRRDSFTDDEFHDAVQRATQWVAVATTYLRQWNVKYGVQRVVVESFVDLGSHATSGHAWRSKRWMAPLVIGMLHPNLVALVGADNVHYQNPAVLAHMRTEIAQVEAANKKAGRKRAHDVLVAGDHQLRDEHMIRAWAHGSWAVDRIASRDDSAADAA